MKHFILFILLICGVSAFGQVRPDDFTRDTFPEGTDAFYTQEGGSPRKILLMDFGMKDSGQIAYTPTATGNTRGFGSFFTDSNTGDLCAVFWDSTGVNFTDSISISAGDTDTRLSLRRVYGTPDTIVFNVNNILTASVIDSIFVPLTSSGGGLSDGDKGDITVASSGTVWTIDNDAVDAAAIATDAVGIDEIAANSVGTSEILNGAVAYEDLASALKDSLNNDFYIDSLRVFGSPDTVRFFIKSKLTGSYIDSLTAPLSAGGGGTDDQTIALDNTALSIESGNTVYLDTLLDRSVAAPNAFGSSFADYFAQIYFSSTDYDEINTIPSDRMTIDSINTTLDFFKVSWDGFDTILYNVEVRDTFSWMINSGAVAKTAKLDSIDLVNHRFYYTMKNGSEFALNDTVEFYNLYASYEMLSTEGTTEKILEIGITDGVTTIGGNTIDWYGTGAVLKKNDGSLVNMIHVEYSAGETGERDLILATSNDMNEWTWDGTVWRDNDEVGWMTCTDVLLTDVDRIPNGYYAGKYICTGSAIAVGDEDPFYFIINEALDTVVGFRERVPDGFVSSTALRPLSVEYFNNVWHEMFIEVKSSPRLNSLLIHAQYATIDDFIAGNHFQIDTITSGADQPSYGFNNGYFDSGTFYAEGGSLSFLYGIQPYDGITGQGRLYFQNRSFGVMDYNGATWDFNQLGPLVLAGIGYNLLDADWDNNNDHLGGYPNFVKWGDDLYLFMTAKGNNTTTEYYKAVIARLWNKTSAGGVDSWDIQDGTIKEEDLATAVTTKLNLQGTKQAFTPTTAVSWDLDSKISGAAHIDCTSVSSGVTLTVSNPNATYPSYYTLYFYNVSGTDAITFPTGWIGEDGTALGTVNLTADKYYACEYINIDASNLYLCK